MEESRISELDGLRAMAILMVLVWHYLGAPDGPNYWLWKTFFVGRFGVDLFFVLSGYLITNILLKHRASSTYFASFYGRRAVRIFPIYYLMCALVLAGWLFRIDPTAFDTNGVPGWTYLFGVQNFAMAKAQSTGVYWLGGTWSLAIEEQFYLLFPLVVRLVPPERLLGVLLAPILICPAGRFIDSLLSDSFGYYVLPQFRADSLAIGALIAFWRSYSSTDELVLKRVKRWFRISLICLPLLWVVGTSAFHAAAWCHTLVATFFGTSLFLILENRGAPHLALLRSPIMAFFAKTSYAAYMIHDVVGYLVFRQLGQPRTLTTLTGVGLTILAFIITFAICALSYRYFESPLIAFGHKRFAFGPRLRGVRAVAG